MLLSELAAAVDGAQMQIHVQQEFVEYIQSRKDRGDKFVVASVDGASTRQDIDQFLNASKSTLESYQKAFDSLDGKHKELQASLDEYIENVNKSTGADL